MDTKGRFGLVLGTTCFLLNSLAIIATQDTQQDTLQDLLAMAFAALGLWIVWTSWDINKDATG